MLKLVSSTPDFFAHSGRAPVERGEGFGCVCAKCDREITAPFGYERKLVWCLYCGMELGFVPMIEHPYSHQHCFGVSREECIEDREALDQGNFDQMSRDRACRYGHIVEFCF